MRRIVLLVMLILGISSTNPFLDETLESLDMKPFDTQKVNELLEQQQYDEAEKLVSQYLQKHPNSSIALGEKAYILIATGKAEEGVILLHKLLLEDPDNDTILNNLSWGYNDLGLYKVALGYAQRSLQIDPVDVHQFINKANALHGLEEYSEAIECYNLAIERDEKCQYAYYGKGLCLSDQQQYDQAYPNFVKAFQIEPSDSDYYYELMDSCIYLEHYNDMILFSDTRINIDSEDSDAYYYKAEAYEYLNEYEQAIQYFDEYIKYSDYDADGHYEKYLIYLKLNNKNAAYESLQKAIEEDEEYSYYIDSEQLDELQKYKDADDVFMNEQGDFI